jgi:2-(1,2-epoxy-1,2-dihydrophenyl)acetyl-CoA isomerase
LPKLVGLRRALDLAFINPRLDADRAEALGRSSKVDSNETFEDDVRLLALNLARGPTGSYAAAKRLMNESAGADRLDAHLDRELEALARVADGADFAEGISAFFEKRAARFEGR